jgi:hypothetical protein
VAIPIIAGSWGEADKALLVLPEAAFLTLQNDQSLEQDIAAVSTSG